MPHIARATHQLLTDLGRVLFQLVFGCQLTGPGIDANLIILECWFSSGFCGFSSNRQFERVLPGVEVQRAGEMAVPFLANCNEFLVN